MAIEAIDREATELVTLPPTDAMNAFTLPGGMEPYLEQIRAVIDGFEPDLSTASGRKQIGSLSWRVSRSKTYLAAEAKRLIEEHERIPKVIRATMKHVEGKLDAWRDEVRKPLDDWEAQEAARKAKHQKALAQISAWGRSDGKVAAEIRHDIANLNSLVIDDRCEEFKEDYFLAKTRALQTAQAMLALREQHERDQAELARLRAEDAKRRAAEAERVTSPTTHVPVTDPVSPSAAAANPLGIGRAPPAAPSRRAAIAAAARAALDDSLPAPPPPSPLDAARSKAVQSLITAGIDAVVARRVVELIADGKVDHVRIEP